MSSNRQEIGRCRSSVRPSTPRPTSSWSAAAPAAWPRRCSAAGRATASCCWRRPTSSAAPPRRRRSGTGCRTTSTCRRSASRTRRRTACATWRGCRAPRPTIRSHPTLGMSQWEYDSYAAIYDNASPATELLAEKGALEYRHCDFVPDYWAELPEDKAPKGRVLLPKDALPTMSDGGEVAIRTMGGKARADGIDIRTGHRVQRTDRRRRRRGDRRRGRHRQGQDGRHQGASAPSSSRPAASPTTSACARISSACRCSAAARRAATRATSSTSAPRPAPSCAT